jgi:hypothetical protein
MGKVLNPRCIFICGMEGVPEHRNGHETSGASGLHLLQLKRAKVRLFFGATFLCSVSPLSPCDRDFPQPLRATIVPQSPQPPKVYLRDDLPFLSDPSAPSPPWQITYNRRHHPTSSHRTSCAAIPSPRLAVRRADRRSSLFLLVPARCPPLHGRWRQAVATHRRGRGEVPASELTTATLPQPRRPHNPSPTAPLLGSQPDRSIAGGPCCHGDLNAASRTYLGIPFPEICRSFGFMINPGCMWFQSFFLINFWNHNSIINMSAQHNIQADTCAFVFFVRF